MSAGWRPMLAADLTDVAAIEAACHNPLPPEGEAVFANRLMLFAEGCFCVGQPAQGYAMAHPWRLAAPPALGSLPAALPPDADCLWLHDLALRPALRGQGLVARLLPRLDALAAQLGLGRLALVAVHGTAPLWARHGFVAAPEAGGVGSYGGTAEAMLRPLSPARPGRPSTAPGH